jgi:hypothetical protein
VKLSCLLEYDKRGYLLVPAELARTYFPHDVLVALPKQHEVWLLPLRGSAAGGLLLKQRNQAGDRSVLLWEQLPAGTPAGVWPAFWDESNGALRIAFGKRTHA